MLIVKTKEATKSDFYTKTNLSVKRPCNDEVFSIQSKDCFKEHMKEIFAGLMWLG